MKKLKLSNSAATTKKIAQPETVALFVSDLHLQENLPATVNAFLQFLHQHARFTQHLFVLGDLFEYWAGDDDLASPFNARVANALSEVASHGVKIFWIEGNRDFLISDAFLRHTGMLALPDTSSVELAGQRIVVMHGDAQCTDDIAYQQFRSQVRNPGWQQAFLAQSLAQRKAIIEGMRSGSQAAQREKSDEIMDVNDDAIRTVFEQHHAQIIVHGHTHRPGKHVYDVRGERHTRWVLPDWDFDTSSPRGGWLALSANGRFEQIQATQHFDFPR